MARDRTEFAYLMEMGTGKTKTTIDDVAWNYAQGIINFFLCAAPNDVHRNWAEREIPAHMPDWVDYRMCVWSSSMKKKDWEDYWSLWDAEYTGLRILLVNHEAFSAEVQYWDKPRIVKGKEQKNKPRFGRAIKAILNSFNVFWAVDESSKIKTPGSTRTERMVNLSDKAKMRRILTGTLGNPLESYAQFLFLNHEILGHTNFYSYKHRYAEWETDRNWKTGKNYEVLKGYKRLTELNEKIKANSFRVLKKDCLDLPEKIYKRRIVRFEKEQSRIYEKLKQKSILELTQGGVEVTMANVLVRYLRLQQVIGGWVPNIEDPSKPAIPIFKTPEQNPRIRALLDLIEENGEQSMIIWARFRAEIEAITDVLNSTYGKNAARSFYGGTPKDERSEIINRFQDGSLQWFVGQQQSGGYGLTLTAATVVAYYSNLFSLFDRLQTEDRCHRIGQHFPVLYADLEVPGSLDTRILQALLTGRSLADLVVGDDPSQWFGPLIQEEHVPTPEFLAEFDRVLVADDWEAKIAHLL